MTNRNLPEVWEIEWVDSTISHGWQKDGEARGLTADTITNVGFVVEETDNEILVSPSTVHMTEDTAERDRHSRFECVTVIPKVAIRRRVMVRKARR